MAAAEAKRLRDALSRVGVMGSEVPKATFATKHLEQDLGRLLTVRGRGGGGRPGLAGLRVGTWKSYACGCDNVWLHALPAAAAPDLMGSEVPKATFATKHLEQDLGRLLTVRGVATV